MVWGFNSFTTAYNHLESYYETSWGWWHWINEFVVASNAQAALENWELAINYSNSAITWLATCSAQIFDFLPGSPERSHLLASIWYASKEPTGAEITWQDIVEAWIANDFEGRALTIAVIDRMRQILWDEPYNVQWAARPEDAGT